MEAKALSDASSKLSFADGSNGPSNGSSSWEDPDRSSMKSSHRPLKHARLMSVAEENPVAEDDPFHQGDLSSGKKDWFRQESDASTINPGSELQDFSRQSTIDVPAQTTEGEGEESAMPQELKEFITADVDPQFETMQLEDISVIIVPVVLEKEIPLELLGWLARHTASDAQQAPVVAVLSAFEDRPDEDAIFSRAVGELLKSGADAVVAKPASERELRLTIKSAVAQAKRAKDDLRSQMAARTQQLMRGRPRVPPATTRAAGAAPAQRQGGGWDTKATGIESERFAWHDPEEMEDSGDDDVAILTERFEQAGVFGGPEASCGRGRSSQLSNMKLLFGCATGLASFAGGLLRRGLKQRK